MGPNWIGYGSIMVPCQRDVWFRCSTGVPPAATCSATLVAHMSAGAGCGFIDPSEVRHSREALDVFRTRTIPLPADGPVWPSSAMGDFVVSDW